MSDPESRRPEQPEEQHPEQSGDYPRYPSTPHPEDRPDFGSGYGSGNNNSGYGSAYDAAYGAAASYQGGENYPTGVAIDADETLHQATAASIFASIGFAFRRLFRSPAVFLLGSLLVVAIMLLITWLTGGFSQLESGEDNTSASTFLTTVVSLVIQPLVVNLALRCLDRRHVSWSDLIKGVRYWQILGACVVNSVVTIALMGIFILVGILVVTASLPSGNTIAFLVGAGIFLVGIITIFVITVFLYLAQWLVADSAIPFVDAYRVSATLGRQNFWPIIGFSIMMGIICGCLTIFTLGIGILIAMPVSMIGSAHFYRSLAHGAVPVQA